jgi:hypothetical protein
MNLDLIDFVRITGNDFLDVVILQLVTIAIAFGSAELATRWRQPQ